MNKPIVIVGHPYWKDSVGNRTIVDEFLRLNPEAEISNISELYPDGNIDVEAEQKKLMEADTIVLQFPIMCTAAHRSCTNGWKKFWLTALPTAGVETD